MKLRLIFVVSYFVVLCHSWSFATEEPFSIYLTWLQSPETSMSIQWVTKNGITEDQIEFQKEGEIIWHKGSGKHLPMPDELPLTLHYVELTGLQPNSNYLFRLGSYAKVYKFRTMPGDANQPIHFIVGGDMYHGSFERLEETNRLAANLNPYFILIGGDIAYSCGSKNKPEDSKKWLGWLKAWKNTMVTKEGFLIPIVPAIGNHEVRGGRGQTPSEAEFFYTLFPTPGIQGYNVLSFGDYLALFILDSGHTHPVEGDQTLWLKEALINHKNFSHKFAVYHLPAYPSYGKYHSKIAWSIRQNWVPLFEEHGLHAAFENNDHTFKRSHPIYRGRIDPQGILYLGDGAWSVSKLRKPRTPKKSWYIARSESIRHFLVVTIQGKNRRFQAYGCDSDPQVFDDIYQ